MNNLPEFRRDEIARRGDIERRESSTPRPTFILLGHQTYHAREPGFELLVANEAQIKQVELSTRDAWLDVWSPCDGGPPLPGLVEYQLDARLCGMTVTWGSDLREALEALARHTQ